MMTFLAPTEKVSLGEMIIMQIKAGIKGEGNSTRGKMGLGLFLGEVNTGAFENDIGVGLSPLDGLNILFGEDSDLLAVDDDVVAVVSDIALESAVDGVVLELVDQVVQAHEGVVDSGDFDLGVLEGSSEGESSDSTETVDTEFNRHGRRLGLGKGLDLIFILYYSLSWPSVYKAIF